jgi:hypothetical protein
MRSSTDFAILAVSRQTFEEAQLARSIGISFQQFQKYKRYEPRERLDPLRIARSLGVPVSRSRVGTAKRQIRPGVATFAHGLYHAIPFPRVGRKQSLVQAVCGLHPKYGFHRAPRMFEYVRRD